ncbi:MAG: hypothetical protein EXR75_02645 [Myxococcales bacterium]|nr:hypothetical protein [Myxococcales bacterium]
MFARGEAAACPDCELHVRPLADLPPSLDADAVEPEPPLPPEHQPLPWHFVDRGRGPLIVLAITGIATFYAPWVVETAPEIRTLSGFQFARLLPWIWAAGIAWFVMFAIVASRRTIYAMRGARLAVGLMATMVFATVAFRLALVPRSVHPLVPLRFTWGWGLYAGGLLALTALVFAWRFGGRLDDLPSQEPRRGGETLH